MTLVRVGPGTVAFRDGAVVTHPACEVRAGERIAVTGPNGSGKSTLLRVLAGLLRSSSALERNVPHGAVGVCAQRPFAFRTTVRENVALGLAERSSAAARAAIAQQLEHFGLDGVAGRAARSLSEGQQARVAFARALVSRPRLLLLDEPFAALDADGRARLVAALDALEGAAVVVASPHADSLAELRPAREIACLGL